MTELRTLVLGTRNQKKLAEMEQLLRPYGFQLQTLDDFPQALEVEETGTTFSENAALKAVQQARHLRRWVVGEDSGLRVDALDGGPGVYSARFSGPDATDASNNAKLLEELSDVPIERRAASYVSHISLADPEGNVVIDCEDYCHGRILLDQAGEGGFGYDPLFEIREYHRTFGQLGAHVKAVLSHRGRAMRAFVPQLLRLSQSGTWPASV